MKYEIIYRVVVYISRVFLSLLTALEARQHLSNGFNNIKRNLYLTYSIGTP
jgi:hypothetical protein